MRYLYLILALILLAGCTYETVAPEIGPDTEVSEPTVTEESQMKPCWSAPGVIRPGSGSAAVNLQSANLEPGNYTVQFAVSNDNVLAGNDKVVLRADITWFVDGVNIKRTVDVGNGVSVSGVCEKATVKVYDASTIVATAAGNIKDVTITVTLAKGTRPNTQQPPTYSLDAFTLAPGGINTIAIPNNVGAVSVFVALSPGIAGTAVGAYDVMVQQFSDGAILKSYDPRQTDWVPLIPGAKGIVVFSSAAAPTVIAQVTFGIDG